MNSRIYTRAVEIATALKPKIRHNKSHHVCFAIKKSRIVCIGQNSYEKLHPYHKWGKYVNHKNLPGEYRPNLHAETSLCIRLGEEDLSDYEILNIRINNMNQPAMSDFCINCYRLISSLNPKRMFYSDVNGQLVERE